MRKATKKSLLCALAALALIAFAMWLRYASRHIFHSPAVNHLRSGIYKNAVFDTNRKSLLRHISAEKGLK